MYICSGGSREDFEGGGGGTQKFIYVRMFYCMVQQVEGHLNCRD